VLGTSVIGVTTCFTSAFGASLIAGALALDWSLCLSILESFGKTQLEKNALPRSPGSRLVLSAALFSNSNSLVGIRIVIEIFSSVLYDSSLFFERDGI
jgi:hypothetical protein